MHDVAFDGDKIDDWYTVAGVAHLHLLQPPLDLLLLESKIQLQQGSRSAR